MRRVAIVLLSSLVLVAGLLIGATGAQAGSSLNQNEKKIIKLHNKARAANGVKRTLQADSCLDRFAEKQARRQAKQDKLFHQGLKPILRQCSLSTVGENVGSGFPSAGKVHRAWMRSTGHRTNILQKKFSRIGVGMALSKSGRPYYAVVFGSG